MNQPFFYTRKLPHCQPPEETFFVTYRLAGSLPIPVIKALKEKYIFLKKLPENQSPERKEIIRQDYFKIFEEELEKNLNEPHWIKNDGIAQIIMDSLLFNNNKYYTLWCATLMANHVHILLTTLPGSPLLNVILQNHKKFTAVHGNKILGRSGKFWAEESFDTIIRNTTHFYHAIWYILNNPVKAKLTSDWQKWKWTYLHPELEAEYKM